MRRLSHGFTIVELLIVIVVIAILASITIVAYGKIQTDANNAARFSEMENWSKLFSLYNVQFGALPVAANSYCLGSGFPDGKCRNYLASGANTYNESDNAALMAALGKVSNLPSGPRTPINGVIGPYATIWGGDTGVTISDIFKGDSSDCPKGTDYSWDDGNGTLLCTIDIAFQ